VEVTYYDISLLSYNSDNCSSGLQMLHCASAQPR